MALPAAFGALLWRVTYPIRTRRLRLQGQRAGKSREGALLLLFMFLSGLLALTLTPHGFWPALLQGRRPPLPPPFRGGVNLIPLRESWALLRYYIRHGMWGTIWINFPGNILMFLPIGLFAGLLTDRPKWWKGTLWAFSLSLFIEVFQLFVSRGTDIDDLILNTLGGLLGHWAYLLLAKYRPQLVKNCEKR